MDNEYTREQLLECARLSRGDFEQIQTCRTPATQLGYGYQLAFVRLLNKFPYQDPFEVREEVLAYVAHQLGISVEVIGDYGRRRMSVSDHQERIRHHLQLQRFTENKEITQFIFEQACRLEQTHALLAQVKQFLYDQKVLEPAESTLTRLIKKERKRARVFIFDRVNGMLGIETKQRIDALLVVDGQSPLQKLKETPRRASPSAIVRLAEKLDQISDLGILTLDFDWLNNNFQRAMARYVRRCTVARLRGITAEHRYTALVCFLRQCYLDTVDDLVVMYDKLINKVYNRAGKELDQHSRSQRTQIRRSLSSFKAVAELVLDTTIDDSRLREAIFSHIEPKELAEQTRDVHQWLTGKYSDVFLLVRQRFSYIRQFAPTLMEHLQLEGAETGNTTLLQAVDLLRELNEQGKRKLPQDAPIDFLPKKLQSMVMSKGKIDKASWECGLLTTIRDQIKSGNVVVRNSKRFGQLDDYFMPEEKWLSIREDFFRRAGLPADSSGVATYLSERLSEAYDHFLTGLPDNEYASIDDDGWVLSKDAAQKPEPKIRQLKDYLHDHMRVIKLPQLLIEVDNELHFTRNFMTPAKQLEPTTDDIRGILAAVMAHGCNIGPYTMAHLIDGISYGRIKHISDWMLTEETQRSALVSVVNAISRLDITQAWGSGKTSSSDGQRFALRRKIMQQSYSSQFHAYALEFYSFIADNYAPFYSLPIECTDRDAPYVIDGLVYNETDLPLEEHYTDTHGYTEINFAAFAMLGRRFSPRIKGVQKQRIYRIDAHREYGPLLVLLERSDRNIHLNWITQQWDRMGHFYASLESGHTTASVALKRLNGFTGKNHFYRANRELGRVFKTEHILRYMSDPLMRKRTRTGLLKSEQLHALARDLNYGKRGHLHGRDWLEQQNSCSCLTLILACIIYWQAKEIHRVMLQWEEENFNLVEHISPITWDNVILYGEYVLDRDLIRL